MWIDPFPTGFLASWVIWCLVSDLWQAWAYIEARSPHCAAFAAFWSSAHALCACRWPREPSSHFDPTATDTVTHADTACRHTSNNRQPTRATAIAKKTPLNLILAASHSVVIFISPLSHPSQHSRWSARAHVGLLAGWSTHDI